MEKHGLAVLRDRALWEKFGLETYEANHPGLVTSLLFHLISEFRTFGDGQFLNEFWEELGSCNPVLKENISKLEAEPGAVAENDVSAMLFDGVLETEFSPAPIFSLAGKYFTHLGMDFMKPRSSIFCSDPYEQDEGEGMDYESFETGDEKDLILDADADYLSLERKLKYSVFNRDGFSCVMTGIPLEYPEIHRVRFHPSLINKLNVERDRPNLALIIPLSVKENPATLDCLATLVGNDVRNLVLENISTVGNAMVLEQIARYKFDELAWAIEVSAPSDANGAVQYIYRSMSAAEQPGPLTIKHQDGSIIEFGKGKEGGRLGVGPLPELCRLRLAVTRALGLSGAAELIWRILDDPGVDTSTEFRQRAPSSYYLQMACLENTGLTSSWESWLLS